MKEEIKKIFLEIDTAIESTKSKIPVNFKDSQFLKAYKKIKEKYLNAR